MNAKLKRSEETMRIGVIGAGWLGGTVGRIWAQAGHEVLFSSRTPEKFDALVQELGPKASAGTFADACKFGDVVLLSVRYPALPALAQELAPLLRGKIILDACNPFPPDDPQVIADVEAAGVARTTASYFPTSRLVRAFSSVDADEIEKSSQRPDDEWRLAVPLAGDDAEALAIAQELVRDAGCTPLLAGGLAQATLFERGAPAFRTHADAQTLRQLIHTPNP